MNDVGIKITAQDQTGNAFNSVTGKLNGLAKEAQGINGTIGGLVGKFQVLGVAISAATTIGAFKSLIDTADNFSKLAQKTGVAVEQLRELNYAAALSDVSTDALGTGLRKLSINMASAAGGGKEQAAVFKALGLSVKDASGSLKGADTMLSEVAAKFASFKDGPEKAALAVQLFGKAGADMIPLLNAGATGLSDMAKEARDLGTVFSGSLGKQAEEFNDNLTRIGIAATSTGYGLATELLPTLNTLAQTFLGAQKDASSFGNYLGAGLRTAIEVVVLPLSDLVFVIKGIAREIGGVIAQVNALGEGGGVFSAKGRAAWNSVGQAMREDAAQARAELDKWQQNLVNPANKNVGASYNKRQGFGETYQTNAPVVGGGDAAAAAAAKKAIDAANKSLQDQANLLAELSGLSANFAKDWDSLGALYAKRAISIDELTAAQATLLAKQPAMQAAEKQRLEAAKENTKAVDDLFDAQEKLRLSNEDQIKTGRTLLDQIEFETRLLDLNAEARAIATMERDLEAKGIIKGTQAYDEYIVKLREAMSIKTGRELSIKAADDMAAEQKKAAEESSKYWEDALMRAFESGKGFFQSLWDTIKNTLKTQVLKVTVQGVMGTLGIGAAGSAMASTGGSSLMGQLGGSALSNYATSAFGASIFGSGAAYGAAIGTTSFAAGSQAAMLAAQTGEFGLAGLTATSSAAAGAGAGASSAIAAAGPYVAAALALYALHNATQGETRSGGQYGYSFNGITADNARRGGTVAASGIGATFLEGPSGGSYADANVKTAINATVVGINALLKDVGSAASLSAFQAGYETSTGDRGGVLAGGTLSTGATFGETGAGSNYKGDLFDASYGFELNNTEALKYFAQDLEAASIEALQAATDLPEVIAAMVKGFDTQAATLTQEAIAAKGAEISALLADVQAVAVGVNTFRDSLNSLPFDGLKNMSFDAAESFLEAAAGARAAGESMDTYLGRGLQNLTANLGTYYDAFYTSEEKRAQSVKNIATALDDFAVSDAEALEAKTYFGGLFGGMFGGIFKDAVYQTDAQKSLSDLLDKLQDPTATAASGDEMRKQYRAIVEAQDLTTESGQKAYAALLSVSGAFSSIIPSAEDAAAALKKTADAAAAVQDGILALVAGISTKVGGSLFEMQYGMKDNQGKYGMLDVQAATLNDKMLASTDINAIAKMASDQIDLINKSWALLDPTQQNSTYLQFEDKLNQIDTYVQSKGADATGLQAAKDKQTADTIAAAVEVAVAKAMASSAAAMQAAADKADKPIVVESHVTVTAPAGSEVSIT